MEGNSSNSGQQTIQIQVPTVRNIAGNSTIVPLSFAVAIILFFFTFCEFKCTATGETVQSIKGINLVVGKELKEKDMFSGREKSAGKIPPNFWAILALGSAIIGLGVYLIKEKREALIGVIAGTTGFVSLFILQYVIKNKITKDSEGQVSAVFQFSFWLALVAFIVAGVISYLRRKQFQPGLINLTSTESPSSTQNISTTTASPVNEASNFDMGKWLIKNKRLLLGTASLLILVFIVYLLFFKHNPIKDGKNSAASFCNCGKKEKEKYEKTYKNFIADFESYKFSGRNEANQKLNSLIQTINDETQKCFSSNRDLVEKLKSRYVGKKEDTKKFQSAYTERMMLCNNGNTEINNYYNQALDKINAFIGPVEKEQLRQDSIAAVNARLELQASLDFAEKNQPTIERMKQDFLGRTFSLPTNELNWTGLVCDNNVKYLGFKISDNSFQKDSQVFTCNADMLTTYANEGNEFNIIGIITYTWDTQTRTWNFQDLSIQQFKKIK